MSNLWLKTANGLVPVGGDGGGTFTGEHVLEGDPDNPPAEWAEGQLLYDPTVVTGKHTACVGSATCDAPTLTVNAWTKCDLSAGIAFGANAGFSVSNGELVVPKAGTYLLWVRWGGGSGGRAVIGVTASYGSGWYWVWDADVGGMIVTGAIPVDLAAGASVPVYVYNRTLASDPSWVQLHAQWIGATA